MDAQQREREQFYKVVAPLDVRLLVERDVAECLALTLSPRDNYTTALKFFPHVLQRDQKPPLKFAATFDIIVVGSAATSAVLNERLVKK
jgi:hypothetical protein